MNYIATWFYKESKDEASFYPQGGGKGELSSASLHLYADSSTFLRHLPAL